MKCKAGWIIGGLIAAALYLSAAPGISNIRMSQRAGTRYIDITYDLSEAAIVTLSIETNGVALPESSLTRLNGDVCRMVEPGSGKTIVWNAGADWSENFTNHATARLQLWTPENPPRYCMVDLTGGHETNTWPVYYYTSAAAVPNGTTSGLYKTQCLLLRRIDPGTFMMGSPVGETGRVPANEQQAETTLTRACYLSIYQLTQAQWQLAMGDLVPWPARFNNNDDRLTRAVESVSYHQIREIPDAAGGSPIYPGWPASQAAGVNSFMGRLRNRSALYSFDLPTEAQWEHACRAGTTGALNDGTSNLATDSTDSHLAALGRYLYNGGRIPNGQGGYDSPGAAVSAAHATATVGSYLPNAWGLYDMHGNVREWCLDRFTAQLPGGTDPGGTAATASNTRVLRGGYWDSHAKDCRSASRHSKEPAYISPNFGFRVALHLPLQLDGTGLVVDQITPEEELQERSIQEISAQKLDGFITLKPWAQILDEGCIGVGWMTATVADGKVEWTQIMEPNQSPQWRSAWYTRDGLREANQTSHRAIIRGADPTKPLRLRVKSRELLSYDNYVVNFGTTATSEEVVLPPLKRANNAVSFVTFNDIHNNINLYLPLLEQVSAPLDFVVLNGDLIHTGPDDEAEIIDSLLAPMAWLTSQGLPVIFTRGNHETRGSMAWQLKNYLPLPDNRYYHAMTLGPIRAVILDAGESRADSSCKELVDFDNQYTAEQLDWLAGELGSAAYLNATWRIILVHVPPDSTRSGESMGNACTRRMNERFRPVLDTAPATAVISGHYHRSQYIAKGDAQSGFQWPVFIAGGHPLSKSSFVRVDADNNNLSIKIIKSDGTIFKEENW